MLRFVAVAFLIAPIALGQQTPQVALIRAPNGMMQVLGGQPASDSFVLGNAGTDPVTISIVLSPPIYTFTPSTFTIEPRAAQLVVIRPNVSEPGLHESIVTVSVAGVSRTISFPVRLYIGQQPFGTVTPGLGSNTIVLRGRANEVHRAQLNVSNFGNAIMTCMLTADVPWILPPRDIVGVEPRGTKNFAFEVNPSARPDGSAPLGAIVGKLKMLHIRGTDGDTGISETGTTTATVIDITKATAIPQQPAPLAAGEVASFLAGVSDTAGMSQVFLSNRTTSLLSGVQLFYSAAGAGSSNSLLAALGQFPAAGSAWFPYAPESLFDVSGQTGSIQMRTLQNGQASLSGLLTVMPDDQNVYATAIPVLSSTNAVPQAGTLVFSGVDKSASASTDIHIQETAGFAGTFTVEFFGIDGVAIPPARNESIEPFAYVALQDAVPAGAFSARVTNTSASSRLAGYATVIDSATRDRWTITDSRSKGSASEWFLPMPGSSLEVYVTNASASPVEVTFGDAASPSRRRAVRRGSGSTLRTGETSTATLAPNETRMTLYNGAPASGHIRVNGPAGAISVSGRIRETATSRAGQFGTGIPALPQTAAATTGVKKYFALADDEPGVSPNAVLLLETANRPATVRVTMHFNFPGGSTLATGQSTATQEYEVTPGALFTIDDIVRSLLGPRRDELGRLFQINLEVEVTAGDGVVLPYLERVDPSGDLTLLID